MAFNINDFQARLRFGGARPSLFEVQLAIPPGITGAAAANLDSPFKIRATTMPGFTINNIELPYFGRFIKVRGIRQFQDWTVTVIQDEDFLVRDAIENWQNAINRFQLNTEQFPAITGGAEEYKGSGTVLRYRKDGDLARSYTLDGIWPIDISPVPLDWSSNEIEEFQVTFSVDEVRRFVPTLETG